MPDSSFRSTGFSSFTLGTTTVLYLLLLAYGTLFPLQNWIYPTAGFWANFLDPQLSGLSKADVITNVLVYLPAGLLLTACFLRRWGWPPAVLLAVLIGTGLSFCLEAIQVFLPARISALSDLLLNSLGTAIGACLALMLSGQTRWGIRLHRLYHQYFTPGHKTNIGLIVLALWALSQLSPLVPSFTLSLLLDGIRPFWLTISAQSPFVLVQSLVYLCHVFALGVIFLSLCRTRMGGLRLFSVFLLTVLLLKVPVVGRQLSLEAITGSLLALLFLVWLHRRSLLLLLLTAAALLVTGFFMDGLRGGGDSAQYAAFNWIPFKGHMQNIVGLANILASAWCFLALGYIFRYLSARSQAGGTALIGLLVVTLLAAGLEILQLGIPGRYPDITDILIAMIAWSCAWVRMRPDGATRRSSHAKGAPPAA